MTKEVSVEVQSETERDYLEKLAKKNGVIDAGTTKVIEEFHPLPPIPGTIDAGQSWMPSSPEGQILSQTEIDTMNNKLLEAATEQAITQINKLEESQKRGRRADLSRIRLD